MPYKMCPIQADLTTPNERFLYVLEDNIKQINNTHGFIEIFFR